MVMCYGVFSPVSAYAGAYYSHQLSAAFLVAAFLLVKTDQVPSAGRLLLAGFCMGFAVLCEYSVLLVAGVLFVYALYRMIKLGVWPRILWVMASAGAVGACLAVYNTTVFGGPFNLGYEYSELWSAQHQTGFMSLTMPSWDAIWGITFSPFRGLFYLSPVLLLSLPGFIFWWKSRQFRAEFWAAAASVAAMFFFNASSAMWWGGFAVGPRYFLPALPFIAIAAAFAVQHWYSRIWFKVLFVVLSIWSVTATWGLTIAGQSFPSDQIRNPFVDYAIPNWAAGNIARNFGTVVGLEGDNQLCFHWCCSS